MGETLSASPMWTCEPTVTGNDSSVSQSLWTSTLDPRDQSHRLVTHWCSALAPVMGWSPLPETASERKNRGGFTSKQLRTSVVGPSATRCVNLAAMLQRVHSARGNVIEPRPKGRRGEGPKVVPRGGSKFRKISGRILARTDRIPPVPPPEPHRVPGSHGHIAADQWSSSWRPGRLAG